jgi:putative DNA primase/helicase
LTDAEQQIKLIHELADHDFKLGFEIRPSINKATICLDKGTTLDNVTTTKEQIEKWKQPNITLQQWEIDFFKTHCKATDEQIENIKKYGYFANGINILMGYIKREGSEFYDSYTECFDFDNDDDITLNDFLDGFKGENKISKEDLSKLYYIEHHTEPYCRIHIILRVDKKELFRPIAERSKNFAGIGIHANHWITTAPSPYNNKYNYTKLGIYLGQSKLIRKDTEEYNDLLDRITWVSITDRQRKKDEELFNLLEPYLGESQDGKRHNRYLPLIGLIRKYTNKTKEETKELVTKLCERFNNTDSLQDRLDLIDSTWQKDKNDISSYEGLKDFMKNEDLEKLKKLLGVDVKNNKKRKFETDDEDDSISEKIKKSELQKQVFEELKQDLNNRFIYLNKNNFLYFESGMYKNDATDVINARIQSLYGLECNINDKKQIVQFIKDDNKIGEDEFNNLFDTDHDILNLKNGLFNVQTGEKKPHTPDHYSRIQFPFEYDESATCPIFIKYMEFVFPDEKVRKLVYRLMANTFILNNKDPYITLCVGNGGRGKGILFKILEKMHGQQNICAVELYRFGNNDSFAKASLEGKNVNFDTEINEFNKKSISALKQLASEDVYNSNQKHEKARFRSNHAKHFFSCNSFPPLPESEKNNGAFRRLVPIPYNVDIPPAMKNKYLNDEIVNNELSGIFNLLVPYIKEIRNDPTSQVFEISVDEVKQMIEILSDPVAAFIEERYDVYLSGGVVYTAYLNELGMDYSCNARESDFYVQKKILHDDYLDFCKVKGIDSMDIKTFGKLLKEKMRKTDYFRSEYNLKLESFRTINGKKGIECWNGLRKKMDEENLKEFVYKKYTEEEIMEDKVLKKGAIPQQEWTE